MSSTPEGKPPPDITWGKESGGSPGVRDLVGCLPVLGSLAVGVLGVVLAVAAFFERPPAGPGSPTPGLCLIASALGFGLLANAIWRK
jgi:hypothetical protein